MFFEGQMRSNNLVAASVVLTACFVGAAGPAGAMVRQAPIPVSTAIVPVGDEEWLPAEKMRQQQQQQEGLQREEAAKAMRRAAIRREEAKIVGAVKKYLRPEYGRYYGGQGSSPDTGMAEGRNR